MFTIQISPRLPITLDLFFHPTEELERTALSLSADGNFNLIFHGIAFTSNAIKPMIHWAENYIQGKHLPFPSSLPKFSNFKRAAYFHLMNVPFGKTISYGELATLALSPQAARAAGTACRQNLFPLFIPCHRVLAANQKLGGFACGLSIKKTLLQFENSFLA